MIMRQARSGRALLAPTACRARWRRARAGHRASRPRRAGGDHGLHVCGIDRVDLVEADGSGEKRGHRHLVGGVEHGASLPGGPRKRVPGELQARESARDRRPRSVSAPSVREVERRRRPTRCARARPGRRRSARACRACRAAPAPSWSRHTTIEWMMLCGWITTWICSGARSNSQRASITSSALFIMVAESTEILRPITQFGMRAGLVGRHVGAASPGRGRGTARPTR